MATDDQITSAGPQLDYDEATHQVTQETRVPTPLSGTPTRTVTAEANILREYVGALGLPYAPWMGTSYIRQLPVPMDDLSRDFGTRLYDDDMMRDAQVFATLSILVMAVLVESCRLETPVPIDDPQYEMAKKIDHFCEYVLQSTEHPFPAILYELIEGSLKMGHKIGEKIYELTNDYEWQGDSGPKIVLKDIKTKAHGATAFVVDAFNNVLGLVYVRPGYTLPLMSPLLLTTENATKDQFDPSNPAQAQPALIPRSKFIIAQNHPKNTDPRGTSHLKAVYTPWWQKLQWVPQHLAYVARFAQPSIWIKLPPESKDIPIVDPAGNITGYKSIVQASNDAGVKLKGGAVATFVNADANMMEAKSEGKVIFDSYVFSDRQIAKGILMQTLTTEEAEHMARASSSVHQDVFGIVVASFREYYEWMLREDLLRPLVYINYGEKASRELTPTVSLGSVQQQDRAALINSIAALALAGGVHPSQWPGIWEQIGFPKVDEQQWLADQKILEAQRSVNLEMAQNPVPPVSMNPSATGVYTPAPYTETLGAAVSNLGAPSQAQNGAGQPKTGSIPPPQAKQAIPQPSAGPVEQLRSKSPTKQSQTAKK